MTGSSSQMRMLLPVTHECYPLVGGPIGSMVPELAPVAQGIEHTPPERGAQVRILPGAQTKGVRDSHQGQPPCAAS
jgi:hypothetical protein